MKDNKLIPTNKGQRMMSLREMVAKENLRLEMY